MLRETESMAVLKPWIVELTKKIINFGIGGGDQTFAESDTRPIFQKRKQGKINGKEPGLAVIGLI